VGVYPQETQRLTCSRLTQQSAGRPCRGAIEKDCLQEASGAKSGVEKGSPLARVEIVKHGLSKPSFKQKRVGSRKYEPSVCGAYYAPRRKSSHRGRVNLTIGIGRKNEEWEAGSTRVLVEV